MNLERRNNRYDTKWGHPYAVASGRHIQPTSVTDLMKDLFVLSDEEVLAKQKAMNEGLLKGRKAVCSWEQNYTEVVYEVPGCPEEPDAPLVEVIVATPKDIKEDELLPVIFSIPGGGMYCGGNAEVGKNVMALSLYKDPHAVIIHTSYRLSPVHKYPAALNDMHACYQWMVEHAAELHVDTDKVVIYGGSAGGMLAICLAFRMKRYNWCGTSLPRGLFAQCPMMDDTSNNPSYKISYEHEGHEYQWSGITCRWGMQLYLGDELFGDPGLPPEAVPNRAKLEDVKGFPPTWLDVGEHDNGRDSVLKFAMLLTEAGNFCELHMWGGLTHNSMSKYDPEDPFNLGGSMMHLKMSTLLDSMNYDFRRPWLLEEEA